MTDRDLNAAQRLAIREGKALHTLLEQPAWLLMGDSGCQQPAPRGLLRRIAALGLLPAQAEGLWRQAQALLQQRQIRELLMGTDEERAAGVERLPERSWTDGRGGLMRPDLVLRARDLRWLRVIDFKRSLPSERMADYEDQVRAYCQALQSCHPTAEVSGWLLAWDGQCREVRYPSSGSSD